ncbi:helix-turn-helix domain-containing protein [Alcanivorax sp. JB21]|uniref:helix-turn-helix transcriptional regulator n=1 Tax=Alcanivorax limicola TaxID=2874102 RepID=UPI001CBD80F0|nr:helix-turn-helix transcriptional regulator [Alcanivorax limicola]MBZ2190276.1 helix-turn-helix domain-containing protein [Alcanivorax limicola]
MSAKEVRNMFYPADKKFSRAEDRALAREELIYNVTEDLLVLLEKLDVSKVTLARHLGRSRAYVSQLLTGSRNMTLGTLSDICFTLGVSPRVSFRRDRSNHSELTCHANWKDVPVQQVRLSIASVTPILRNERRDWHALNGDVA